MAIENAKTLNVRIKNKYDSYENWAASGLVLEAGEIAIAYTTVDVKVDNGTAKHPALLMKVGDGEKTFANLPWLSAKAADVLSVCKNEEELKTFVDNVIADAGIASDDAMEALAERVTTAEDEIDGLQADLDTAETGLKARMATAERAIDALELLVSDTSVAAQIDAKIAALNLADTYAAKVHKHEIADVNGLADSIAAAKKAGTDAAAALETYKTTNDAAVKVNSDAIAGIKNGETIDNFKEVEEALAGKQAVGDYATKTEAQGYANAKDAAIQAAQKAGDDAQGDVDALAEKVGIVTEGKTVVQMIADAQTAATYDDTEVKADIGALKEKVGDNAVGVQISEALKNYTDTTGMNSAIATAKGEAVSHATGLNTAMNTRVEALEAIDHDHSNKTVLDGITAEKVAAWDAAEGNAKAHATALDTAMDQRVDALEAKFTGEGSVADQIDDAVAAEAKLREDADTALQEQITANDGEIATLQGLVGGTSVSTQIADAVKVEKERAEGVEANLDERLEEVEAFFVTAEGEQLDTALDTLKEIQTYITGEGAAADQMVLDIAANKKAIEDHVATDHDFAAADETLKSELEDKIDLKADQTALNTLAGRVTTVEGDLNGETTGLKAKMAAAEAGIVALDELVGDTAVATQISNAITKENLDQYAKATDLVTTNTEVAKKANSADLAAVATSGDIADLTQASGYITFDCGTASINI